MYTEKQYKMVAAKRSTQTSVDSRKVLGSVVQPQQTIISKIVKKKRAVDPLSGQVKKQKKNKDADEEEPERASRVSRYKDPHAKKDTFGDIVTQVARGKKKMKLKVADSHDDDDEDIADPEAVSRCGFATLVTSTSTEQQEIASTSREKVKAKVGKWEKMCGKLAKKKKG